MSVMSLPPLCSPPLLPLRPPPPSRPCLPSPSLLPLLRTIPAAMAASVATTTPPNWSPGISMPHHSQLTLLSFLAASGVAPLDDDMVVLMCHLQTAFKQISALLASPLTTMAASLGHGDAGVLVSGSAKSGQDVPKPLDLISNDIMKSSLRASRKVAVLASEEDEKPVVLNNRGRYVVVFDPLDGSRNIDASIPTGTIFGIYRRLGEADDLLSAEKAQANVLQKGERLVAAGYALYSSATVMCVSYGSGTHIFTLDRSIGEFVLTNTNVFIPQRGQIYSVNDARYFDWPQGLRKYVDNIRQGEGQHPKKYSARYICSLVADFHRTLLYGGVAMNPRDHLRLVYEANPLSFLSEQASGKGSDGKRRILSIQPMQLHQRLPLFLGSIEDVSELENYGDVQQLVNPGYEV